MVFLRRDGDEDEIEAPEDEDATLADDVLDEVEGDADDLADATEIEGFGLVTEKDDDKDEEEDEGEEDDSDESLEDDAEDVDFDTFDDVDEM